MEILDTLKNWAESELNLANKDFKSISIAERRIIRWYFFGSCDVCAQAMNLSDSNFQDLYRQTLKHIGIPREEIEESIAVWMFDKIEEDELFFIKHGAHSFRSFKDNPEGVGGLSFCFSVASKKQS